jgi:2-polyprenyl-6-methoxyphenol hydroxylase-like FAD-dependent oxidoreductase
VLATGPNGSDLLPSLGIQRTTLSEKHSLTFGFDVQAASRRILVYYGERAGDGMDYLTVFPMGDTMRGNLFCYRDPSDPWVRSFKLDPKAAVLGVMPSLERTIGPFEIVGKVQARPISIERADTVGQQAGVVLIGDAFQTSCPAAGTGIGRILADVEALRRLIPQWLATPGMRADKIAQFYADPAKRRFDAKAIRYSQHRRALCTRRTLGWTMYRKQHYLRRRAQGMVSDAIQREMPRVVSALTALSTFLLG